MLYDTCGKCGKMYHEDDVSMYASFKIYPGTNKRRTI